MNYKIAVIPGDGIGPEIVGEAKKVLDAAGKKYRISVRLYRSC
ncbi:MAG: isocitrate/isopropylmalate family dehydrogenase [Lachnospiraceae bacterium]